MPRGRRSNFRSFASAGAVVTITNDTNSAFNFGANAIAQHIWQTDGTLDEKDNTSPNVQINSSTDWIIPNSAADSSYRNRHTSATGDTGTPWVPAASINVWASMTSARGYQVTDTTVAFGGQSVTYVVEMDKGTGTALDSGTMTLTADREDF